MYSYEDRIRAVRLYIKLGQRVATTIRQLGYPTKNALKSWHREYERCHDLPVSVTRSKPKYSDALKNLAVEHYLSHGRSIAATIRALGYPGRAWLSVWIHELHPEMRKRVIGTTAGLPRSPALRQAAVIALCTRQGNALAVAQKLGVCRPTLYNWKNQLLGPEAPASMKHTNESPPEPERAELEQQIESLRRDIRHLQLERDILKKANEIVKKRDGRQSEPPDESGEDASG